MSNPQTNQPTIALVANGDLRLSANQTCWPEQERMEAALAKAIGKLGGRVIRAHGYDEKKKHGFIDSQKMGIEVFRAIDPTQPLIVAEAVWQYSQHLLPGLFTHRGPILTVANWSGTWPGLVGMLNLNGSLTKMGLRYSTIWSERFTDAYFVSAMEQWLTDGVVTHDQSHVRDFDLAKIPVEEERLGREAAAEFRDSKPILGVFDEGCMGMHNAIIPDELLNLAGVFKERLSQSALYAATREVSEEEAAAVYGWLRRKGISFQLGTNEETELTERQVLEQCKMYLAAVRMAADFGCAAIGIQ